MSVEPMVRIPEWIVIPRITKFVPVIVGIVNQFTLSQSQLNKQY